tara:strand:+ start:796 stop:1188 length:393 start_codon:yes stop_codon:yes gene_type:complete
MYQENSNFEIFPMILNITMVKNTGAAFSLFSESTLFLAILSLLVSAVIIIWGLRNSPLKIAEGLFASFLLGGTIGNGIDRWRLGYVIDFLQLIPIKFPIFNFADISINIAVLILLVDTIRRVKIKDDLQY